MAPQHICRDVPHICRDATRPVFPLNAVTACPGAAQRGASVKLRRRVVANPPNSWSFWPPSRRIHSFRQGLVVRLSSAGLRIRCGFWNGFRQLLRRNGCPAQRLKRGPQLSAPIGRPRVLTRMRDPTPSLLLEQDWAPCYQPFGRSTGDFSEAESNREPELTARADGGRISFGPSCWRMPCGSMRALPHAIFVPRSMSQEVFGGRRCFAAALDLAYRVSRPMFRALRPTSSRHKTHASSRWF